MKEDIIRARNKLLLLLKSRLDQLHKNDTEKNRKSESNYELPTVNMGADRGLASPDPPPPNARNGQTNKAYKTYKTALKIVKEPLEIAAIIGGLVVAVLIYWQYRAMVGQMDANLRQANAAENQLRETHEDFIADQRAWIGVHHIEINDGKTPATLSFNIVFQNTGKTPALDVAAVAGCGPDVTNAMKFLTNSDIADKEILKVVSAMMPPNMVLSSPTPDFPASAKEFIEKGGGYYLWGKVWYEDIFGRRHWTVYCSRIIDGWKEAPMPFGNTCDIAQPEPNKK